MQTVLGENPFLGAPFLGVPLLGGLAAPAAFACLVQVGMLGVLGVLG